MGAPIAIGLQIYAALAVPTVNAQPLVRDSGSRVVQREILALYDGREEPRPELTRIHRMVEMPLNHLGFIVTYWDLNIGLPGPARTDRTHGVVTWLHRPQSSRYYNWAGDLVARGMRFVVLGDGELAPGAAQAGDVNRLFQEIGFEVSEGVVDLTYGSRVLHRDRLIGFEQQLDPVLPAFPVISSFGPDVTSHLVLEQRDGAPPRASSVVLTSPRGGFAADGYLIYSEPVTGQTKWIIDPFAFFQTVFVDRPIPIPDVTTLSGRRIYFSHIDGDGWNNVSQIEAYRDRRQISAQVVLEKLIAPYPDLPVTVGVIGANLDEQYGHATESRRVAAELFALPRVEVATHSYTHPYQWSFFENYERQSEERAIEAVNGEGPASVGERLLKWVRRLLFAEGGKPRSTAKVETFSKSIDNNKTPDDPPRAFSEFPFDLDQETRVAAQAAERLAPPGKRTALYLWSGDAEPFEAAVARTRQLGLRNMNGGDSRLDPDYPSISYLSPIGRPVGTERQIYAGNANDFLYISDAGGRDHGYLHLDATLRATETPRRLKPVNIYYHMYAGERAAQIAAVRFHLENARRAAVTPIAASRYAAIADGFYSTEIVEIDPSSWIIRNRGALESIRFDDAKDLIVDYVRSIGVLGQRHKDATLYVALDGAEDRVVLALARMSDANGVASGPYLIESRWTFRELRRRACGFSATTQGFGAGQMRWSGLSPGVHRVVVRRDGALVWERFADVDDSGELDVTVGADAVRPLVVDVSCVAVRSEK